METTVGHLLTFLLNSLWQIAVIACVSAVASRLLRNGPARLQHGVWVAALIASVVLPVLSTRSVMERSALAAFTMPSPPQLGTSSPLSKVAPRAARTASHPPPSRTVSYGQTTATTLGVAYLLLVLFRLAKLLGAFVRTTQIRRSATLSAAPPLVRKVWQRCAESFGLSDIRLLTSRSISTPATAGSLRKVIILPESLLSSTNVDALATAIGHEMAHLARNDFGLNLLYQLLAVPIWFNPASLLILRRIEETREMACDELVTEKLLDRGVYAKSLVSFAAAAIARAVQPGYLLGVFDGDILEQRVRRLLHPPVMNLKRARLLLATSLTTLTLCCVVANGITINAKAQNDAAVASKVKTLESLMKQLRETRDTESLNQVNQLLSEILALDPINPQGLNATVNLALWSDKPREAHEWALKILAAYPKEKTSYYTLAVTDWSIAFPAVMTARNAAGLRPSDAPFIPDASTRRALRDEYGSVVDEGLRMLESSVKMDPNYSEAMAYMNLLYRLKAFMAENVGESTVALTKAEEWVGKSIAARKKADLSASPLDPPAPPPPPPPPPPKR